MAAEPVGTVDGDGDGGDVVREADGFFVVGTSLDIDEQDREVVRPFRDGPYPTLEALVAALPRGVRFRPREG
jgi:hypothetical protein